MRRPNRNIEIFSLSVLDLFSAAMGAFIIISLILFPYYMRNKDAKVALAAANAKITQCVADNVGLDHQVQTAQAQAKAALAQAAQTSQAGQDLKTCLAASASTFIVTVMRWADEGYDVDLHVTDPQGRVYYFASPKFGDAELSYDNKTGPGIEIWQHPKASAGTYCIAFHIYDFSAARLPSPAVTVDGRVFFRNGATEIPPVILDERHYYAKVGSIDLTADGKFSFQSGSWGCAEEPEANRGPPKGTLGAAGKHLL